MAQASLPSLELVSRQVARERETMNAHAESLDTKAGVVLGFAGVLVGLGATAQSLVSVTRLAQVRSTFGTERSCANRCSVVPSDASSTLTVRKASDKEPDEHE